MDGIAEVGREGIVKDDEGDDVMLVDAGLDVVDETGAGTDADCVETAEDFSGVALGAIPCAIFAHEGTFEEDDTGFGIGTTEGTDATDESTDATEEGWVKTS